HEVSVFRGLVDRGRKVPDAEEALLAQGSNLYRSLLGPVEPFVVSSARILVIPDGALHALPFAALVRSSAPLQYVAQWKPLHVAAPAGVYQELGQKARATAPHVYPAGLVIFAPAGSPAAAYGRNAADLPGTRAEARELVQMFPGSRAYVAAAASEEQ